LTLGKLILPEVFEPIQIPILLKLKPEMTVHEADRYYKMWCFDADFRQRMTTALRLAGLHEE
jgi:hypothetical protein